MSLGGERGALWTGVPPDRKRVVLAEAGAIWPFVSREHTVTAAMFAVQDKVGDYEIVAKLKAGGMATLFLGKRCGASGFSRHVAIKVVHEHLASDPTFVQMFVDEALLSSKIHHPNVVHVEELRQVDGRHFLVMEYVHGTALSSLMQALRVRQRALGADLAVYVAVKVAEGLHAAHTATDLDGMPLGVVHRDVSPQNVLLAYRGNVKLIDFGIAKAKGRAQQTTGGSLKGKIRYMSPEQAFGRPVDRRTDVYALGVVLWEMLTNRKAFDAPNEFALLEKVRNPEVPPARTFNPDVPEVLDEVIQRALAADPDARFQTAQEMRRALAKAAPSALALDASDLERLLAALMDDAIRADVELLPDSVSGVLAKPSDDPPEEAVLTLTVSAAGLSVDTDPSIPHVPEAHHEVARTVALEPHAVPTPTPMPALSSEPVVDAARSGPRLGLIAAGLAFLLIVVVGGGVFALMWDREADITATELPRRQAPSDNDTDPVASPEPEPDVLREAEPVSVTATEPVTEPVTEPATEPAAEPATEPAPGSGRPRRHRRQPPASPARPEPGGVFLADDF